MPQPQDIESTVHLDETARTTLRVEPERVVEELTDNNGVSIERYPTDAQCFALADLYLMAGRAMQGTYSEPS